MKGMDRVRIATLEDVDNIFEIEKSTFIDFWGKEQIIEDINNSNRLCLCLVSDSNCLFGYIIVNKVLDFAEILRFAISIDNRRQGKAEMLYNTLKQMLKDSFFERIYLEVREKNFSAISFYKKMGFKIDGFRESYYSNGESALLMSVSI